MWICVVRTCVCMRTYAPMTGRYECAYEKMYADMWIGVNENMCLYANTYAS